MKGLLIKDIRILLRQKMTLLIIVLLGIFMSMNGGNSSFALGYIMVVSATLVVTTISYDYFEKGMSFILTLPVSRKTYVLEKYLLAVLVELVAAGLSVLIQLAGTLFGAPADWNVFLATGVGCLVAAMIIVSVYIPVYMKCGPEKSRVAIFIVIGLIAAVSYLVAKVKPIQDAGMALIEALSKMTAAQLIAIGVGIFMLIIAASVGISIRIMKKKEF